MPIYPASPSPIQATYQPPIKVRGRGGGTGRGGRYRWKASNMRQKFQLPLPGLSGGVQMHPGFLVLRSNLAAENPRSWDILTGKGCSSHRQGLLPFPLELPEFCPFMASALPAPQHSSPLCEVSVIFGCPLPSFLSQSVRQSPICRPWDWTSPPITPTSLLGASFGVRSPRIRRERHVKITGEEGRM